MNSILQDYGEKIKRYFFGLLEDKRLFLAGLLILVALVSFGLGRRSLDIDKKYTKTTESVVPVTVQTRGVTTVREDESTDSTTTPMYVASKNGQVYHLIHCSGAKRISEENKIYFSSKKTAEAAGLRPAANCPGI